MRTTRSNSIGIEAAYRARTKGSETLYFEARKVIPAGLTHDSRAATPYPIYVARASGPRKWDVDDNEYVDYFGGHGSLLLGHAHPAVLEAVRRQVTLGTHWGASHELEVRWAAWINSTPPRPGPLRARRSVTTERSTPTRFARPPPSPRCKSSKPAMPALMPKRAPPRFATACVGF